MSGTVKSSLIAIALITFGLGAALITDEVIIPLGLPREIPVPDDNPITPEKIELGRRLFFDPILSDDGSTSCSTCHVEKHGFAGERPIAIGIESPSFTARESTPVCMERRVDHVRTSVEDRGVRDEDAARVEDIKLETHQGNRLHPDGAGRILDLDVSYRCVVAETQQNLVPVRDVSYR